MHSNSVFGQNSSSEELGLNGKDEKTVVTIDGFDYLQESHYGASGIFDLDSMVEGLGVEVFAEDEINAFPDPKFGLGSRITITRATPVTIIDGRSEIDCRTWSKTVDELLTEQGIELGEEDKISVELDEALKFEMEIKITRVLSGDDFEYESIDYQTITKKDPTLEKGKVKVEQVGQTGRKKLIYKVVEENGVEISRELVGSEVVKEAQNKIVLEGTKVVKLGTGTATWYDYFDGYKAASNTLPYGTKVLVRNNSNGKEVVVTIVDHGIQGGAIIDLSVDAFKQLASLGTGRISVTLEKP